MKGYTNSKGIASNEIVSINIIGVDNPTFTVSYSGTTTTYTGNITLLIPDGIRYTITFATIPLYITPQPITYTATKGNLRNINVEYIYNPIIDLSLQDVYGNPIQRSTANCYIIKEPGQYKFPLVYGNAIKNGEINYAAFTNNGGSNSHDFVDYKGTVITSPYIEEVSGVVGGVQLSIADTNNIFTDISIQNEDFCRYVSFNVSSVPSTGANGVISIKDSSGVIMWSWHIWVWSHDLTPVTLTNSTGVNYNILPVNLASTYDSDGVHIKNWFYQFGRPTPLLGPTSYKSNTNATSYGVLALSVVQMATYIYTGILNPNIVYYSNNSTSNHLNWFSTNSDKALNLWDAACTTTGSSDNAVVKTVYDPSPVGFHVPNGNTFSYFSTSNIIGSFDYGYKFKKNSSDSVGVFFPASGNRGRTTGVLENVGSYGSVWTSASPSLNYPAYLRLYSGSVTMTNNYKAFACSIRPVQDDNIQLDVIMINFTIWAGNFQYQAESGMTWLEWVNSEYNVDGWYIDDSIGQIVNSDGTFCVLGPDNLVEKPTDVINGLSYNVESALV